MKTQRPFPRRLSRILVALLVLSLTAASVASAAPFAYVSNFGSGNVSVIDVATNTVVATVPVGRQPYGTAANPVGTRAYIANFGDDSVSVIDTRSNTVVATVLGVGAFPSGVAVSVDSTKVYVASGDGTVAVIDAATNSVVGSVSTGGR